MNVLEPTRREFFLTLLGVGVAAGLPLPGGLRLTPDWRMLDSFGNEVASGSWAGGFSFGNVITWDCDHAAKVASVWIDHSFPAPKHLPLRQEVCVLANDTVHIEILELADYGPGGAPA